MIRGHFVDWPYPPQRPTLGIPFISAYIKMPRLGTDDSIALLVDSGADITCLHLSDAARIIGLPKFHKLENPENVDGVTGTAEYYVEPAKIVLLHENGNITGLNVDIRIAKPSDQATAEFEKYMLPIPTDPKSLLEAINKLSTSTLAELSQKFFVPSVLGRDILRHFRLVIDWPQKDLLLER